MTEIMHFSAFLGLTHVIFRHQGSGLASGRDKFLKIRKNY
jgi:hypothetical protein